MSLTISVSSFGLKQHVMVKVTGVYVVGSFVVMMILYLAV